jgi:outer membrane lipoprotein-sorting protein
MKNLSILFITLFVIHSSFAQYDPEAKVLLEAMSKKYQSKGAFSADFTQKLTNESAGLDESISGTIYVKGDKYKLKIAGQEIFNDGKNIWAYNKEGKEVTVSTSDPDEEEISLSNIWNLYKEGYKYGMNENDKDGNQVVDLEPSDRGEKSYYKIRMTISTSNELKSFVVFENTGNKYEYFINVFKDQTDLDDKYFTFDIKDYPGVELIDFR